jgi:hypothetical protein
MALFCRLAQILRTTHAIRFAPNALQQAPPVLVLRIPMTRISHPFQTLKPQMAAQASPIAEAIRTK